MAAEEVRSAPVPPASPADLPAVTPEAKPFQFGTRTLLAVMAAACLLLAFGKAFGAVWALTVLWFAVLVAAHIAANTWGKKNFNQQATAQEPGALPAARFTPADNETVRQLQSRAAERIAGIRLGWTTVGVTVLGVLLGAAAGGAIGLACFDMSRANAVNGLVVAAVSAGVLGGFLGFWCASFVHVFCAYNVAGWEGADRRPPRDAP